MFDTQNERFIAISVSGWLLRFSGKNGAYIFIGNGNETNEKCDRANGNANIVRLFSHVQHQKFVVIHNVLVLFCILPTEIVELVSRTQITNDSIDRK